MNVSVSCVDVTSVLLDKEIGANTVSKCPAD
jgi:hypothetical protein